MTVLSRLERYVVELSSAYLAWSSGMGGVELRNKLRRVYVRSILPAVVFVAVALPLNEVLQSPVEQATIDHCFNFILLFSVDQNGIRRWATPTSGDRIQRCSQQFDHWKDRVETAHRLR